MTKNHSFVYFLNWNLYYWVYKITYYFSLYFFSRGSPSLSSLYAWNGLPCWERRHHWPIYINSQKWLALSARRCVMIGLDMTRNSFIYHSLKCVHKVTDKYDISIVYLTIALQVSLTTSMQNRSLTADIKLLNWSFDSMRICCLFHTRLRQINPKSGTKTSINSSIIDSTYHWNTKTKIQ